MQYNRHSELTGKHAAISASKYHWLRYDEEKMKNWFRTQMLAKEGSELHELAARLIEKGLRMPRNNKTLNRYVNDGISYRMKPEQILFYSYNCFGTADTISYRDEQGDGDMILRIHDFKSGVSKASLDQLMIYAALFCLEYGIAPFEISAIILRIYQNDEVVELIAESTEITAIMEKIVSADKLFNEFLELAIS